MLILIFVPVVAAAADIPVEYLADFKEFKRNAIVGDSLSFDLYTDATCTGAVAHAELKFVGGAGLTVEKTLPQRSKGEKPSPTKGVRLHSTLSPSVVAEQLYLKVVGTGVVALGGECQPQAAAIPGPPGESAQVLHLFDANDLDLGILVDQELGSYTFFRESEGVFRVKLSGALDNKTFVEYETPDCTGQGYVKENLTGSVVTTGGADLFLVQEALGVSIERQSEIGDGVCFPLSIGTATGMVPADPLTTDLTFPLVVPFRIELAP